ncbi:hypothetical protein GE21DRAFT_1206840 [Neurospora crassa]|nr:hypothetical protein GE21DRAFT_1206840 [Neurospora crassa]
MRWEWIRPEIGHAFFVQIGRLTCDLRSSSGAERAPRAHGRYPKGTTSRAETVHQTRCAQTGDGRAGRRRWFPIPGSMKRDDDDDDDGGEI